MKPNKTAFINELLIETNDIVLVAIAMLKDPDIELDRPMLNSIISDLTSAINCARAARVNIVGLEFMLNSKKRAK